MSSCNSVVEPTDSAKARCKTTAISETLRLITSVMSDTNVPLVADHRLGQGARASPLFRRSPKATGRGYDAR